MATPQPRPGPGEHVAQSLEATKVFDRASWIYAVWHPVKYGTGAVEWPGLASITGACRVAPRRATSMTRVRPRLIRS